MKKTLSLLLIGFILVSFTSTSYAQVKKDETVYVNLKNNGNVEHITVVNHISGDSNEEFYTDYGKYNDFQTLISGVEPIIEENKIKWPTDVLNAKDIYYEGSLNKPLPLKINIKYFLDDNEIKAEELAGKSGRLKILISIKDSSKLITQIQVPLNLNVFSNINAPSGVTSVVGKTMTVVFNHLPIENQDYILEADGVNIELDSIMIASTASNIGLPNSIEDGINQLTNGMDEMSNATEKLQDGSVEINKGTNALINGLKALTDGIKKLASGTNEINLNSKTIQNGFKEFNNGLSTLKDNMLVFFKNINDINQGLNTLSQQGNNIKQGLITIKDATNGLDKGLGELSTGLTQLNTGHEELVQLAKSLATSSDPRVKALAEGIIQEGMAIKALNQGAKESSTGMKALSQGANELYGGLEKFNYGIDSAAKGFNQMSEELKPLPGELDKMIQGHTQLTNGLEPLFQGIKNIDNGLNEISTKTSSLPYEVKKIADGQDEISKGLEKLNEEGFKKIKSSMDELTELQGSEDNEEYSSFADNENNKDSTVQFIMKTPSIKIDEKAKNNDLEVPVIKKKNFIQRFLDLFRK